MFPSFVVGGMFVLFIQNIDGKGMLVFFTLMVSVNCQTMLRCLLLFHLILNLSQTFVFCVYLYVYLHLSCFVLCRLYFFYHVLSCPMFVSLYCWIWVYTLVVFSSFSNCSFYGYRTSSFYCFCRPLLSICMLQKRTLSVILLLHVRKIFPLHSMANDKFNDVFSRGQTPD